MKKLTILCDGGLGNRLGTLVSGIAIAEQIGAEPVICWPSNTWCGCYYDDLFVPEQKVVSLDINQLFNENKENLFMLHENQTALSIPYIPVSQESTDKLKASDKDSVYYNNSIPSFLSDHVTNKILGGLKVQGSVLYREVDFAKKHNINRSTIGIHLRKTDGLQRVNEGKLLRYIMGNSSRRFFVCSDDKDTEDIFRQHCNVIIFPKEHYVTKRVPGSWNQIVMDQEGRNYPFNVNRPKFVIIEAFIDMLLLSRTTLHYMTSSSFLKFAYKFGAVRCF